MSGSHGLVHPRKIMIPGLPKLETKFFPKVSLNEIQHWPPKKMISNHGLKGTFKPNFGIFSGSMFSFRWLPMLIFRDELPFLPLENQETLPVEAATRSKGRAPLSRCQSFDSAVASLMFFEQFWTWEVGRTLKWSSNHFSLWSWTADQNAHAIFSWEKSSVAWNASKWLSSESISLPCRIWGENILPGSPGSSPLPSSETWKFFQRKLSGENQRGFSTSTESGWFDVETPPLCRKECCRNGSWLHQTLNQTLLWTKRDVEHHHLL